MANCTHIKIIISHEEALLKTFTLKGLKRLSAHFMKQAMMRKVLYALLPILAAGIYFFGWRVLLLLIAVTLAASITEWIFVRKTTKKVTEAVWVTSALYTLTLPPSTPFLIAIIGIVFGVIFGKMVFGGFGRNPFNPALVGRAFIYVNFPTFMTLEWVRPLSGTLGGFTAYMGESIDAVTQSTPMLVYRAGGALPDVPSLFFGNIAGSIGETSALLILLAGIYLIWTKAAAKETMFSVIGGFLVLSIALRLLGMTQVLPPLEGLLSGGLLFGAVFMATDPISSPKTTGGRIVYGILIGCITVIIRGFALFAGGIMFAILIGNTFAPILDEAVKGLRTQRQKKQEVPHGR